MLPKFSAAWLALPALLTLTNCSAPNEAEFHVSSFSYNTLPDYTEYGYNTGGARFTTTIKDRDRDAVLNDLWMLYSSPSALVTKQGNNVKLSLNGMKALDMWAVDIFFTLQNVAIDSLQELLNLNGKQYSTQKGNLSAEIATGAYADVKNASSASLDIKRSRAIYTGFGPDEKLRGVTLSGTFELSGETLDGASVKVSDGRFDILFSGGYSTTFDNNIR